MKPVLSAGVQYRLRCMAAGGRPAPQISWYKGDQVLDEAAGSPMVLNSTVPTNVVPTSLKNVQFFQICLILFLLIMKYYDFKEIISK